MRGLDKATSSKRRRFDFTCTGASSSGLMRIVAGKECQNAGKSDVQRVEDVDIRVGYPKIRMEKRTIIIEKRE